jgi:hypothetical protein
MSDVITNCTTEEKQQIDIPKNASSEDDSIIYEELYAMSTAKKIDLICDSETSKRRLYALKNTGFKINPMQFDVIFDSFSVKKRYNESYIKILMDMGLNISQFSLEKMLIEQRYDMGTYHEDFSVSSIIAQLIDYCSVNAVFSLSLLKKCEPHIERYNFQTVYSLDMIRSFLLRCSSANTIDIGLLVLFIMKYPGTDKDKKSYPTEKYANDILSGLYDIITKLYEKGANLNEAGGCISDNYIWMDNRNLVEMIFYYGAIYHNDISINITCMKLLLHILNIDGYKYKATSDVRSVIYNLINIRSYIECYKITNKKDKYAGDNGYIELFNQVCAKLIDTAIINNYTLHKCLRHTINKNDDKLFEMLLKNRGKECSNLLLNVAFDGRPDMAKILLDNGAEVDYVSNGNTALKIACERGDLRLAQFLIERGADPLKWNEKFTPYKSILQTAQSTKWRNDDLVNYLLKHIATLPVSHT